MNNKDLEDLIRYFKNKALEDDLKEMLRPTTEDLLKEVESLKKRVEELENNKVVYYYNSFPQIYPLW